jgi:hypothetical protein
MRNKTICEEVCEMKTVTKRIPEVHCETYTVPGCLRLVCVPSYTTCFDPCTCQMVQKQCGTKVCLERGPCETKTRQVCTYRCVCETVPCKRIVHKTICEKVPQTVCKKIPYTVVEKVPVTVTRMVKETQVHQVPYIKTTMCREVVKKCVPCTVNRIAKGCFCESGNCAGMAPGSVVGTGEDGPGKTFIEGGVCSRVVPCQTTRMVREEQVKMVPYTVCRNVPETVVKQVPYTTTKMVQTVVQKCVPVTTCTMVQETCVKQVPTQVCTMRQEVVCKTVPVCTTKMVAYNVMTKVPYKTTECVPVVECKRVPVVKEYSVCVKKPRVVCEECPAKACNPCPAPTACGTTCGPKCGTTCDPCGRPGILDCLLKRFKCSSTTTYGEPVVTSPAVPATVTPPPESFEPIGPPKSKTPAKDAAPAKH